MLVLLSAIHVLGNVVVLADRLGVLAVGTPDGRGDPVVVTRSDDDRAGAVAEDECGVAVGGLHDDRHRLDADDKHVLG